MYNYIMFDKCLIPILMCALVAIVKIIIPLIYLGLSLDFWLLMVDSVIHSAIF